MDVRAWLEKSWGSESTPMRSTRTGRLDPEDIALFQTCCERVIRRYGGRVAAYLGDGILVYFGYPRADEHDPERAVRPGLEIAASVRPLAIRPACGCNAASASPPGGW